MVSSVAGTAIKIRRPPWRSRPSWFFRVQMVASRAGAASSGRAWESSRPCGPADQGQAEVRAGEELLGFLAGQALVGDDGGAGLRAVRRLAFQGLAGR
jgi:hypothetical protein